MSSRIESIRRRIDGCRQLLSVFQDERRVYQAESNVGVNRVMAFLEKKKSLMPVLEAATLSESMGEEPSDEGVLRALRGELTMLLEQLLVIDNENEKLLRRVLNGSGTAPGAPHFNVKPRPALQQRLPFCPDQRRGVMSYSSTTVPSSASIPRPQPLQERVSAPSSQPAAQRLAGARLMPRTQLQQYIDAGSSMRMSGNGSALKA